MKRRNVPAVHSIDHFALAMPDLEEAHRFYDTVGLTVRDEAGGRARYTAGNSHCRGRLFKAPAKRLHYICFGIFAEDEASFSARLDALGVKRFASPAGATAEGIWFEGFDGLPLNVRVAEKVTATDESRFVTNAAVAGESGAVFNSSAPKTQPRRLSPVAIYTSDVIAATAWYEKTLGLRLSDASGPVVAFLHVAHDGDHHLLALIDSTHRGLHHSIWDVGSVQEIGLGSARLMRAGHARGWSVGRHVLGASYFYCASAPWGGHAEYSADIDFIPATCAWPTNPDYGPGDRVYLWGPNLPKGFIHNTQPAGA